MADDSIPSAAALNAMGGQVDDLLIRVSAGAKATDQPPTEFLSSALYDAERALRSARRALERAERSAA